MPAYFLQSSEISMWREHVRSVHIVLPKLVQENVDVMTCPHQEKGDPSILFLLLWQSFACGSRKWRSPLLSNMQLRYQLDDLTCSTKHSQNPLVDIVWFLPLFSRHQSLTRMSLRTLVCIEATKMRNSWVWTSEVFKKLLSVSPVSWWVLLENLLSGGEAISLLSVPWLLLVSHVSTQGFRARSQWRSGSCPFFLQIMSAPTKELLLQNNGDGGEGYLQTHIEHLLFAGSCSGCLGCIYSYRSVLLAAPWVWCPLPGCGDPEGKIPPPMGAGSPT